ncbi:hypothetical protein NPIL_418031 [Nephila pilipes]|uniref:Uncharacterized protein n=1 Tax=Nephila pilipes TaxID=299642 RepID=A0A8X6JFS3_NEPPI|nr:hypothetical protein NPIL_418031 [Nephila pilipes]
MKRKSRSIDVSSERVCFNDDDDTKVDSSFSDDAVPLHLFYLGQDIYAAVTYFANGVQIHLRQYGREDNNRLFPTKRGMFLEKRHILMTTNTCVNDRGERDVDPYHRPGTSKGLLRNE